MGCPSADKKVLTEYIYVRPEIPESMRTTPGTPPKPTEPYTQKDVGELLVKTGENLAICRATLHGVISIIDNYGADLDAKEKGDTD